MSIFGILALCAALASVGVKWASLVMARKYERLTASARQNYQSAKMDYQSLASKSKAALVNIKQIERDKKATDKLVSKHRQTLAKLQEAKEKEETLTRLQREKLAELATQK